MPHFPLYICMLGKNLWPETNLQNRYRKTKNLKVKLIFYSSLNGSTIHCPRNSRKLDKQIKSNLFIGLLLL